MPLPVSEIYSPKDETKICLWLIGLRCNWLASSCVMKERWAPSSNRICPSIVVCSAEMLVVAVFNKHILVEIAESDDVAAAVGVSLLWVVALTVLAAVVTVGEVTWSLLVVTAGVGCNLRVVQWYWWKNGRGWCDVSYGILYIKSWGTFKHLVAC